MIYPENAEVHILEDEDASRAYLLQVWAEAMSIYHSGKYSMKFSKSIQRQLVEVQKESAAETALNDEEHADLMASFAQLLSVGEYNTAFMDLESGAVDAVAIDIGVAQFQIEGKEDQYQILDETISSEQYAVGFFLGNTALRDEVQSTLLEMVEDGTFAEISNQYFGYDVCTLGK